ncbi:MAG: hypothetical protein ACR2RE_12455, partial [Geminicoccaceae bacterium]
AGDVHVLPDNVLILADATLVLAGTVNPAKRVADFQELIGAFDGLREVGRVHLAVPSCPAQ